MLARRAARAARAAERHGQRGSIISMVPEVGRRCCRLMPRQSGFRKTSKPCVSTGGFGPGGRLRTEQHRFLPSLRHHAGGGGEVEITDRTVFYVPDNYLVGTFRWMVVPRSRTRLPASATDPPQRGAR